MFRVTLSLCLLSACAWSPASMPRPDPVLRLHGHNDYLRPVPLRRALELGLGSIEADVFLVDGQLLVGHERWQLRASRTLESMYLQPLQEAAEANGKRLRADGEPLVLLVECKTDGVAAWPAMRALLWRYRSMLTRFIDGRVEPGAVTVLLSGRRPTAQLAAARDRWCALDGQFDDLQASPPLPPDLVPWVSLPWRELSDWTGSDELMPVEVELVTKLVRTAHAQGRRLRFWGAPDRKEGWRALFDLGVDRIGTDQPKKAARWLRAHRGCDPESRRR